MRIGTYRRDGSPRVGFAINDSILDVVEVCHLVQKDVPDALSLAKAVEFGGVLSLLEGGEVLLDTARQVAKEGKNLVKDSEGNLFGKVAFRTQEVSIMAPIPRPKKNIVCLGLNYRDHYEETLGKKGVPLPSVPVFFTKAPTAVVGPFDEVLYPLSSTQLDYEVELAFVVGKSGKNIPRRRAYEHIAGYMIMNDVTARDLQRDHIQWFRGKSLDTFAPMGPFLVTSDEVPEPHNLETTMKVNGEIRQKSNTSNMIFSIDQIIETLSSDMTLEAGDIVATGTPSGVGVGMTPPRYLQVGDVMEAQIGHLGLTRNTVAARR